VSETAILFLKKTADGSYEFSDPLFGTNRFQVLPKASSGSGLARLESALLNILEQAPPGGPYHDDLRALYLLEGLPALGREGMSRMVRLANSPDPNIALAAIGTLLKAKRPQNVELLKQYLDNYHGDKEPVSVWSIGAYLREIRDPEALPALEALSGSRFTSVQLGAMDALRKIKSPSSAPVLIQRLDDPNGAVRYQAVISLAEMFGKQQEFAPSMKLFEDDPQKYVALWKTWWSQQQGVAPRPTKRP
jgi:HEAT repeat protein